MSTPSVPTTTQWRLMWFTFAITALALLLTAVAYREEGPPTPWTMWALPVVLMANALVTMLRLPQRWPRAGKALLFISLAVTLAVLAAQVMKSLAG